MNYESKTVFRPITGAGGSENVSFSNTNAQSGVLRGGVYAINANQDFYLRLGSDPVAVATDFHVPANTLLYIRTDSGEKIAVLRDTTDGVLNICLQQ